MRHLPAALAFLPLALFRRVAHAARKGAQRARGGADGLDLLGIVIAAVAIALSACHLTAAQAAAFEDAAAETACKLLPLAGPDIPAGVDAWACAMANDAATLDPSHVAAVKASMRAAPVPTTVAATHVPGHGFWVDRRAVMAVSPAVKP